MRFLPQTWPCYACTLPLTAMGNSAIGYYEVWGDEFNGTSLDPT